MIDDSQTRQSGENASFQEHCLVLLEQIAQNQTKINRQLTDFEGQNAIFHQQVTQSFEGINQKYMTLNDSETALHAELKKFQTGGPKQAMATIFHKLFRDLLRHMNQLDDLSTLAKESSQSDEGQAWIESLHALHGHFESLLNQWGCRTMPIVENVTIFDPEYHEAVEPGSCEIPTSIPENTIVKVQRRGWLLQDYIVQYPEVVVS